MGHARTASSHRGWSPARWRAKRALKAKLRPLTRWWWRRLLLVSLLATYGIIALAAGIEETVSSGNTSGSSSIPGLSTTATGAALLAIGALLIVPAVILVVSAWKRRRAILAAAAAPIPVVTPGPERTEWGRIMSCGQDRIAASGGPNGVELNWRLRGSCLPPWEASTAASVEPNSWVVLALPNGRLLVPRSRAEPLAGTGLPHLPPINHDVELVGAVRRLLFAYNECLRAVDRLPTLTHWAPDRPGTWWPMGCPRFLVKAVQEFHMQRRLNDVEQLLARATVASVSDESERAAVRASQEEVAAFSSSLPSGWLTKSVAAVTTGVGLYSVYGSGPPLGVAKVSVLEVALAVSMFVSMSGLKALWDAYRCRRALFSADISDEGHDVYGLECRVYELGGEDAPASGERQWPKVVVSAAFVAGWVLVATSRYGYEVGILAEFTLGFIFFYVLLPTFFWHRLRRWVARGWFHVRPGVPPEWRLGTITDLRAVPNASGPPLPAPALPAPSVETESPVRQAEDAGVK